MPNQVEKVEARVHIAFPTFHFPHLTAGWTQRFVARTTPSLSLPPAFFYLFIYSGPGPVCVLGFSPLLSSELSFTRPPPSLSPRPFLQIWWALFAAAGLARAQPPQNPSPPPHPDPVGHRDWIARDLLLPSTGASSPPLYPWLSAFTYRWLAASLVGCGAARGPVSAIVSDSRVSGAPRISSVPDSCVNSMSCRSSCSSVSSGTETCFSHIFPLYLFWFAIRKVFLRYYLGFG
jgi:hypothetical protein